MDAEAAAKGLGAIDTSIDEHFRSGVYLGVGMCNIILSLIPGKLATLVELFGYKGDRKLGLELLMKAGGWVEGEDEPRVPAGERLLKFWWASAMKLVSAHFPYLLVTILLFSSKGRAKAIDMRYVPSDVPSRPLHFHFRGGRHQQPVKF
jgi:hypothetical protein